MRQSLFILITTLLVLNASAQQRDTIRLENHLGHLYFNATINDSIEGRFIFDTGAGAALIDTQFLFRCHRPEVAYPVTMNGLGNKLVAAIYTTDSIKLSFTSTHTYIPRSILTKIDSLVPLKCDGIIGPHAFGNMVYQIDLPNNQVILWPDMSATADYRQFPYTINPDGFISIEIEAVIDSIKGKVIKEIVHIDTGNPLTIDFTAGKRHTKRLMRKVNRYTSVDLTLRGVGGGGTSHIIALQGVRIGGYFIPALHASIMTDNVHQSSGIVGNDIMGQFDIIIDSRHNLLYLKPNQNFGQPIAPDYRGYFLAPNFDGQMTINGLIRNYKGALKVGDIVTHINGQSFDKISYKEHKYHCSTPDLKYTLTIIRQGIPLEIPTSNLNDTTLWQ